MPPPFLAYPHHHPHALVKPAMPRYVGLSTKPRVSRTVSLPVSESRRRVRFCVMVNATASTPPTVKTGSPKKMGKIDI
ncbi:hypothetical protein GUJ93_ZPchr0012g21299 [Zizania palustris]|uniref:Uncharacterized protein n=1 Tax=Zizania palustris TaxID=103762 RepID=A0A8J6BV86_ZIZPA|nr:hypothetical protein GUJ93_ZPchr0012g21299 [Zizania palustris]